eukprot:7376976-Prymnesium_polylepis.1
MPNMRSANETAHAVSSTAPGVGAPAASSAHALAPCMTTDVVTSSGGPAPNGAPFISRIACAVMKRSSPIFRSSGAGRSAVPIARRRPPSARCGGGGGGSSARAESGRRAGATLRTAVQPRRQAAGRLSRVQSIIRWGAPRALGLST